MHGKAIISQLRYTKINVSVSGNSFPCLSKTILPGEMLLYYINYNNIITIHII